MVENLTVDYKPSTHDEQGHLHVDAMTHLGPFVHKRQLPRPLEFDDGLKMEARLDDTDLTGEDDLPDFDAPHTYGEGAGQYQVMAAQLIEDELERWLANRSR